MKLFDCIFLKCRSMLLTLLSMIVAISLVSLSQPSQDYLEITNVKIIWIYSILLV
jgi:hypothetical protein